MNTTENTTIETTQIGNSEVEQIKLPTPRITATLKAGSHAVTITEAALVANHNGKPNIHLVGDNGTRLLTYNMFLTTPEARANAAKQVQRAFGIDLATEQKAGRLNEAIASIKGRKASFRVEMEEYNGRVSPKVKFVNPEGSTTLNANALADLSFDGPAEVSVEF